MVDRDDADDSGIGDRDHCSLAKVCSQRERQSTSCMKDLIGRRSKSFPGAKDVAVEEAVVGRVDADTCCAIGEWDSSSGINCSPAKARGRF